MTNVQCHEKFKKCIQKVQKSGKAGFSRDCPYDTAVPTMVQGMDMAILFSQLNNVKTELWLAFLGRYTRLPVILLFQDHVGWLEYKFLSRFCTI